MTGDGDSIRDARVLLSGAGSRLACGADVDELLEQAADGHAGQLTGHQQECPHCQAALAEFSRVWEPVRRLAAEPVDLPEAVKAAVASQIRQLVSDLWYTLQLTDGGAIRVGARVVAAIARRAAQNVPGVRVAFGRSTRRTSAGRAEQSTLGHRHPHSAVGVLGRTAVVDLAIAVQYGENLDLIARQVQQKATADLRACTGLRDIAVNVTVDDIIP